MTPIVLLRPAAAKYMRLLNGDIQKSELCMTFFSRLSHSSRAAFPVFATRFFIAALSLAAASFVRENTLL